ncbi:hypothetical protein AVEN_57-1 [Araneus ventricosus]|uniref:Uncharacterized protein n=1 Tax=Araneus ventricosus TaxID=182803 RepID=A0A4Y2HCG9_ARAVE|nr:hypothetical protein AVEN_57-1 [Araneus ventricosus]
MLNDILSSVPVELLDGRLPSSESSSRRDISTEDATENALMHEDSSESTSKQSESSSCRDISTEDATKCVLMHEDFLESTSKPSESSSGKNINTDDETECVPMYEDPSESTSRLSESEPSSFYRDTNTEDSKKRVPLKKRLFILQKANL